MTKMSGTFLNSGACDAGPQGEGKESPSNTARLQTAGRDKYQPYSEYKDSGVEWLGDVPEHWVVSKTSRYFKIAMGQTILKEQLDETGKWPVYSATEGDSFFGYIDNPQVKLSCGDLVIPARGNSIGFVKLVSGNATTTQTTIYCKHLTNILDAKFVFYYMHGNRKSLFWFTQTAIPQITVEEVGGNPLVLPPLSEQRTIAAFLDYETARIDQLIAKQQQLIELLKEKRQAVISHAVTKGLNPNAPMKDSGVEWLGQVPEHWDVWKLNHFCPIITCGVAATPEYVSEGVPFLSAQNIKNHKIDLSKGYKFVSQETHLVLTKYREPLKGDILLSRVGTIGEPCVVDVDFEFSIFVSLTHIRVHETICANRFLVYLLESQYAKALHTSVTLFGGGVGNLNVNDLREYKLPLPTRSKQLEICDYLDDRLAEFSALVDKAERAIELMQERRTALISAAVTGKIDLRGWQPPQREVAA